MKTHLPIAVINQTDANDAFGPAAQGSTAAQRYAGVVQKKADGESEAEPVAVDEAAAYGFAGKGSAVPYKSEMEAGFGVSFDGVRAHSGQEAATANDAMGSKAYAVGNNVAFGDANPSKDVVAHELAHTIQQSGSPVVQHKKDDDMPSHSSFEAEADHAAATVVAGGQAHVGMRTSGASIQRWGGSDHFMIGNLGGQKALTKVKAQNGGKLPSGLETKSTEIARAGDKKKGEKEIKKTQGETIKMNTLDKGVFSDTKGELGLGGASRIGGDYVKTPEALAEVTDGDLYENYGKMVHIASTNSNHFYPLNHAEYWAKHNAAMNVARAAAKTPNAAMKKALFNQAMILEGFACHFLQDTFAAGHHAPRALDAMSSWWDNTSESERGLNRTKYWHDFFCMVPDGLPTTQGRFHGDYYMDGNDLEVVSNKTSESVFQVAATAFGLGAPPSPVLPQPDFSGIMADPVAGPVWRAMMGTGGSDLDGYGADKKTSEKRGASYTTSGGVTQTNDQVLDPMSDNIFGDGKSKAGAKGTKQNVKKSLGGIKHMLNADFHANVHTREDDENKVKAKKKNDAAFDGVQLETYFKMYSGLLTLCEDWKKGMDKDDPNLKVVTWLISRVKIWIAKAEAFSLHSGVKSAMVTIIVKGDTDKALALLA